MFVKFTFQSIFGNSRQNPRHASARAREEPLDLYSILWSDWPTSKQEGFTPRKSFCHSGSQTSFFGEREATTRNTSAVRRLGLAWKSTYFLKITHYGRDLEFKRFAKQTENNVWILTLHDGPEEVWTESRGQFKNTFTVTVYKCSYCFQSLKQWPHLWSTLAKVLLNWPQITSFRF